MLAFAWLPTVLLSVASRHFGIDTGRLYKAQCFLFNPNSPASETLLLGHGHWYACLPVPEYAWYLSSVPLELIECVWEHHPCGQSFSSFWGIPSLPMEMWHHKVTCLLSPGNPANTAQFTWLRPALSKRQKARLELKLLKRTFALDIS